MLIRNEKGYIGEAWLVILLAIIFGAGLTFVQLSLGPKIDDNKLKETKSQIPQLVPGSDTGEPVTIAGRTVYRALAGGSQVGWVVPSSGQGFADKIEILIGFDSKAENITGLYVLDQKETPGLGNKIIEEDWRSQYKGKSTTEKLIVIKAGDAAGNKILAVTGATISSDAVTAIVNQTIADLKDQLASNAK